MKKNLFILTACAAAAAVLAAGCSAPASSGTGATPSSAASALAPVAAPAAGTTAGIAGSADGSYISEDEARAIALENAGLAEADVQFVSVRLDYDDGRAEYDVEFVRSADGALEEYDYEIDALNGTILSMDRDAEHAPSAQAAAGGEDIGEEAARLAALTHAGLTQDDAVNFAFTKLEQDDGRRKYEVEFYLGDTEYDYDIDASSGEVLAYSFEIRSAASAQTAAASVTADQAKQLALDYAGVAEADTRALEMETDRDNGRTVYEFSWKVEWTEYECDVDTATGEIVSFSMESDG